jgi:hypothetical protein
MLNKLAISLLTAAIVYCASLAQYGRALAAPGGGSPNTHAQATKAATSQCLSWPIIADGSPTTPKWHRVFVGTLDNNCGVKLTEVYGGLTGELECFGDPTPHPSPTFELEGSSALNPGDRRRARFADDVSCVVCSYSATSGKLIGETGGPGVLHISGYASGRKGTRGGSVESPHVTKTFSMNEGVDALRPTDVCAEWITDGPHPRISRSGPAASKPIVRVHGTIGPAR